MKKKIIAKNAPKATGPYSHAIQIGKMLFTSGQIHLTPDGKLLKGKIEDETRQILENLKSILEEAGYSFKDVVKTTIFVTDMTLYGKVNEVYESYMTEPYPARETVCVKELPIGARVEISMIAVKD
ncbi:RidA family protein [Candidatus Woesearchaeota archaeon]|nr:RidA family protein [Candidatus Woesearchaeota archaeon]